MAFEYQLTIFLFENFFISCFRRLLEDSETQLPLSFLVLRVMRARKKWNAF